MTYSDQSVMLGDSRLGEDFSILASSTKKELWFQRRSNLYYLLNRQQSQSFSPNLSSCLSAGIHSRRLFQKAIEGFELKINGWALGSQLWLIKWANTNKSEARASGHNRLTLGRRVATLAILTQFKNLNSFYMQFLGCNLIFLYKNKILWI